MSASTTAEVLVTGAAGYLGRALIDGLLAAGLSVRALARRTETPRDPRLTWVEGDLRDPEFDYDALLAGVRIAYHLAWSNVPYSANLDPVADVMDNVAPTMRLAEGAARVGARLVFTSSGGTVYGRLERTQADEDHPTRPISFYGMSKLAAEQYLRLYAELRGLDLTILRIANVYGPGQASGRNFGALATFAERAIRGEEIVIWGDGEVVRDYVYVTDVVAALVASGNSVVSGRVFNVGSGQGQSLNQILEALAPITPPLKVRREAARDYDVPTSLLEIGRARDEIGWAPAVEFGEGIARTVRAWKALQP